MDKKIVWTGKYRDITYEVHNFAIGGEDAWTFYLYIRLKQLPDNVRERFWLEGSKSSIGERIVYNYYDESLIYDLDWHGGCTYYKKHGHDGQPRVVQVGCDYQHLFDKDRFYNRETVQEDAKRCIDSLHQAVPGIMRCCLYCGTYFLPNDDEKRCPDHQERKKQ